MTTTNNNYNSEYKRAARNLFLLTRMPTTQACSSLKQRKGEGSPVPSLFFYRCLQ